MHPGARLRSTLPYVALLAGLAAAPRGAVASSGPALTTSASGQAGYDNDAYAVDHGRLADRGSAFVSAGARLAAAFGPGRSLSYAPAATIYFEEPDENHVKHLVSAAWKEDVGSFTWAAATEFALIDGDDRGVDYGPGHGNAFSTGYPRERRDQVQNRSELAARLDCSAGFARALGKLALWDMRTSPVSGINYVDRHDIQVGLDLGRALRPAGPEVYVGYRRGRQFQDRDARPDLPRHASNHYDRALLGCDGRLGPGLTLAAQVGWARHAYPDDPAVYAGSVNEEDVFTDLTLAWVPAPADELRLKTGQARAVSTTGTQSYLTSTCQVSWRHRFGEAWSATLTGRAAEAEYAPAARDDLACALQADLAWQWDEHRSCTVALSREVGRDRHNAVAGTAAALREFDRTILSLGFTWKH
jgi:hypothetical protein